MVQEGMLSPNATLTASGHRSVRSRSGFSAVTMGRIALMPSA